MVQLAVLHGRAAGREITARRFPLRLGREADAHLRLEDDGVWTHHAEIHLVQPDGFVLAAQPDAVTAVNGHPTTAAVLRNGDVIELGAARVRFAFAPTRPRSLRLREALTWVALGALCAGQIALIYRLSESL